MDLYMYNTNASTCTCMHIYIYNMLVEHLHGMQYM